MTYETIVKNLKEVRQNLTNCLIELEKETNADKIKELSERLEQLTNSEKELSRTAMIELLTAFDMEMGVC